MSTQYIGSKITVVSNMGVRYEGILSAIDTKASTVELRNVVSFGTEGRGTTQIAGSNTVYPNVVFRGSDIKDLKVTAQQPQVVEPQAPVLQDPAIVSQTTSLNRSGNTNTAAPPIPVNTGNMPPPPQNKEERSQTSKLVPNVSLDNNRQYNSNNGSGTTNAWGNNSSSGNNGAANNMGIQHQQIAQQGRTRQQYNQSQPQQQRRNNNNRRNNKSYAAVGTGASLINRRERGHQRRNDDEIKKDFDFQKQLEGFDKQNFIQEKLRMLSVASNSNSNISNETTSATGNAMDNEMHLTAADILNQNAGPKYDKKSSFFDDLSSGM